MALLLVGVFVYRLGHGPLKAERRVRFPYALPLKFNHLRKSAGKVQEDQVASAKFSHRMFLAWNSSIPRKPVAGKTDQAKCVAELPRRISVEQKLDEFHCCTRVDRSRLIRDRREYWRREPAIGEEILEGLI